MNGVRGMLGGLISISGAAVSSLCCVLPVTIVLLGLGSGAFMATTMQYTTIFVPVGILAVGAGFYLHVKERKRCTLAGCRMAGGTWSLALLSVSAVIVAAALFFTVFPAASSDFMMWATSKPSAGTSSMGMSNGSR